MFRKEIKNETPIQDGTIFEPFCDSHIEDVKEPVYNSKGVIVAYNKKKKVIKEPISVEVLENRGIDCDMFTIDNLNKAGVSPQQLSMPQITSSLEERSYVQDQLENFDPSILTDKDFE